MSRIGKLEGWRRTSIDAQVSRNRSAIFGERLLVIGAVLLLGACGNGDSQPAPPSPNDQEAKSAAEAARIAARLPGGYIDADRVERPRAQSAARVPRPAVPRDPKLVTPTQPENVHSAE